MSTPLWTEVDTFVDRRSTPVPLTQFSLFFLSESRRDSSLPSNNGHEEIRGWISLPATEACPLLNNEMEAYREPGTASRPNMIRMKGSSTP
jgi:hypothetical protein